MDGWSEREGVHRKSVSTLDGMDGSRGQKDKREKGNLRVELRDDLLEWNNGTAKHHTYLHYNNNTIQSPPQFRSSEIAATPQKFKRMNERAVRSRR